MFELSGVVKSFQGKVAVQEISLRFPHGLTTVLIGPSGCGKSTLLRLLVGLIPPDQGSILFDGQPLNAQNVLRLRHKMGFVLQDGGLFPHLTSRANVELLARHLGWPLPRIAARIDELADLTRLPKSLLDRYPSAISGGQRQRVAMMRALMLDPPAILLDEPMGALDPLVRYDLQDDLRTIFRSLRKTVVLVTHDLGEAAFFGDDLILLRDGRIVQRGTMADFSAAPQDEFVTRFLQAQRNPWNPA
ncbi:MAG: ATP-binding cassette domain-containing protein [Planctomycetaceae bacterium]